MDKTKRKTEVKKSPKVYLLGGGPGAADLLTLRAVNILKKADIVFYDALIGEGVLEFCGQAKKVAVGKRSCKISTKQSDINSQLLEAAKTYSCVVRLKGGDPMLYARAQEELSALADAKIDVEVVPGITAAFAAAAHLKQPLTERGQARTISFTTTAVAHKLLSSNNNLANADKSTANGGSLIFYMGRDNAVKIAQSLLDNGFDEETPLWIVEAVSTPKVRECSFTVKEVAMGLATNWFVREHPSLIMVGNVFYRRKWQKNNG